VVRIGAKVTFAAAGSFRLQRQTHKTGVRRRCRGGRALSNKPPPTLSHHRHRPCPRRHHSPAIKWSPPHRPSGAHGGKVFGIARHTPLSAPKARCPNSCCRSRSFHKVKSPTSLIFRVECRLMRVTPPRGAGCRSQPPSPNPTRRSGSTDPRNWLRVWRGSESQANGAPFHQAQLIAADLAFVGAAPATRDTGAIAAEITLRGRRVRAQHQVAVHRRR
jgi:hypothetical protein